MERKSRSLAIFEWVDQALHYLVAVGLVVVAVAVLYETARFGLFEGGRSFMDTVLRVMNDLLFVIIILEVLSTVLAHFRQQDFALKPFLIVGTISVVRHILMVGARMSMVLESSDQAFGQHLTELGVNGVLTLLLVLAYYLVSRLETTARQDKAGRRPDPA